MAKRKPVSAGTNELGIDFGEANPKQALFYKSRTLYTAYGGARGGGKSHAVRVKAVGGALTWPGIKILILRRTYPELQGNHIDPICKLVPRTLAGYNGTLRTMYFMNGSTIKFGHFQGVGAETEYQGQEYDWIFLDEATQFTEREFRTLGGCLRGVNDIPKRFYLTCNPGGVGHRWVKRLFIDGDFKRDSENPEENENPKDYKFIFATVEDNKALMKSSPQYLQMLSALPEHLRRAHRYGDWDALSGAYFSEFNEAKHVVRPFKIPDDWIRYGAFDYGLDMLACFWIAVDPDGRCYVYRELCKSGLIVKDAAEEITGMTLPQEKISITFAPPDMWSTMKDTGKTMAEVFMLNGVSLVKASNNRVQGHLQIHELLADQEDGKPGILFFDTCKQVISDIQAIQTDEKNPNDCAKEPHDVTHTCVTGDTLIATPRGNVPISELEAGTCFAWDGSKVVEAECTQGYMTAESADVYEIELDTGEIIKATAEHPVLTAAGWKAVGELKVADELLTCQLERFASQDLHIQGSNT